MTFKQLATKGIKWSTVSQIFRQGMQFFTTVILTRLLSPVDFGLVSMATLIIGFLSIFKDLGTAAAIIQKQEIDDNFLSSIFWVNVIFGLLTMLVLILIAPLTATFYHEQRMVPLLQVLSITMFLSALSITHQSILERNLAFDRLAILEMVATLLGAFFGIYSALRGAGVWSLIIQSLIVVLTTTVLLWCSSHWRPKFIMNWKEVMSVSRYSLNLTGFNIFNYFSRNADNLLIGRYLGAQDLGYYSLAYRLMLYPLQSISTVIGRVMFPIYSRIQGDDAKFRRAYLQVAGTIALVTFPLMIGLMGVSKTFVLAVFGEQWSPVITLLIIMAPVGLMQSIVTTVGVIYQAKGRTEWLFRWGIFSGIFAVIAIAIGLRWGVLGVSIAYAIATGALVFPNFAIPFRFIKLRMGALFSTIGTTLICSLLMLPILIGMEQYLPDSITISVRLALLITVGLFVYIASTWFINKAQIKHLLSVFGVK